MSIFTTILASIVAIEHLYIMYLETFATHSDSTSRVFNMAKDELQRKSVTTLFKTKVFTMVCWLSFSCMEFSQETWKLQLFLSCLLLEQRGYGAVTSSPKLS